MKSECKAKMQNEKSVLTNYKHSKNIDNKVSFCRTVNTAKRNEKVQNEKEWEPKDEKIDLLV